ncbi:hypothetical protein L4D06_07930 [Enterovibrio makurazakiensis]|uniref:hypothetical protein n=1 Tax=Enterovibrio makurazakiensis TaxID=2910232 RepID=UPI003D208AD3
MRKTDKKIDNLLREVLTEVCDIAQQQHEGFEWLTHFANYDSFPNSLNIVVVFDSNTHLANADTDVLLAFIKEKLNVIDIKLKDFTRHVTFDTEERCNVENNGKWNDRFQKRGLN